MPRISSAFFGVGFLVLRISAQELPAQFTFPLTSDSVNGSSATGHCTGATRALDRFQCDDPTSSVVYDGDIPTLTGLDGNMWASQLFTINASSAVLVFDFTGPPNFQVMRVEIVVFNCPQWRILVQSVSLKDSDLTQLGVVNPALSSCDSLVRFCIPNLNIRSSQAVLRLEFTTYEPTDWIHIAEVGFYGNSDTCAPEVIITKPTTATTSVITSNTTSTTSTTTTDTTATSSTDGIIFTPQDNIVAVAAGVFILTVVIAIAIICLKTKRGKACFQKRQKVMILDPTNNAEMYTQDLDNDMGKPKAGNGSMCDNVEQTDNPEQFEMYAVVNKPKRCKPSSQPTQPAQEYAVVNKVYERSKPPSQPTQPPAQEYYVINKVYESSKPLSQPVQLPAQELYAVVDKDSKGHKPPSQPGLNWQEYAVVNKLRPPEVPARS